jgi:hypothetical protein
MQQNVQKNYIFAVCTSLQHPISGITVQHMQQCQVGWNIPLSLFAPGF